MKKEKFLFFRLMLTRSSPIQMRKKSSLQSLLNPFMGHLSLKKRLKRWTDFGICTNQKGKSAKLYQVNKKKFKIDFLLISD